jgi:Putative DNA-binding domain
LLSLIADKEAEGKTLDYKRDTVGKGDNDKREFLYDVSSFANTLGGHLVFCLEETNGEPTNLVGLTGIDPDQEILRLEQILRDGIRPPLIGVQSVRVRLSGARVAIVMHIPKSWNPPHQVTYQKAFRFYGRDSNGKYQLDVDELRSVFAFSATAAEKLKLFRIERVAKIVGGDTPVQLEGGGKVVFHMLPLASFTSRYLADLNRLWRDHTLLVGVLGGGGTPLFNVDGLFLASHVRPATRYAQVFRDGCIEVVVGDLSAEVNQRASLPSPAFERAIIEHLYKGKQLLQHIGVAPPCAIMVTMVGMKGWRIATQSGSSSSVFDRDPVFIPELVLESFSGIVQDECKPLLDAIWNAAGSPGSPNYDDKGQRKTDDT